MTAHPFPTFTRDGHPHLRPVEVTAGWRPIPRDAVTQAASDVTAYGRDIALADQKTLDAMASLLIETAGRLQAMVAKLDCAPGRLEVFDAATVMAEGRLDEALNPDATRFLAATLRYREAQFDRVNAAAMGGAA
jgi:hypothetical protein